MIIFGAKSKKIGGIEIPNTECQYCKQNSLQRLTVFGKYAHIFWIPLFALGRKAISECVHCMRTIEHKDFSHQLSLAYQNGSAKIKRPLWHWLGLLLVGLFVALVFIVGLSIDKDSRYAMMQNDIKAMSLTPTEKSDPISFKIKNLFDGLAEEEIDPTSFEYLTKIKDDKALILVRIPKLAKVKKEARTQAIELIELVTDSDESIKDKKKYIGVIGSFSILITKLPNGEMVNSKLAVESVLYDFYGAKQIAKE